MSHLIVNLEDVYRTYFQDPYTIVSPGKPAQEAAYGKIPAATPRQQTLKGMELSKAIAGGREVFLPVQFYKSKRLFLEVLCCTVRITGKKTIIRSAPSEQVGTVKEMFSIGDYVFSIKGVLIGKNRFPDDKILALKEIYETTEAVELHNAMAELFMPKSRRIAIENIEFPEVEGGSKYHRPFTMTCETDIVETLKIN